MNAGSIYAGMVAVLAGRQVFDQFLMRQSGRIVEHIVIENVITHRQQVHPIAGFWHFEQATFVHILAFQPDQSAVNEGPMMEQEGQITRSLEIKIVSQDIPQIRINCPGIFGADVAGVGIDVELNQTAPGLVGTHSFQGGPARIL
jgi:hypothetical protein